MSDNQEMQDKLKAVAEQEQKKREVLERKLILDDHRTKYELETLQKNKEELERAKTFNFGELSVNAINKIKLASDDYIEAAKHSMTFINDSFKGIIPFFQKNLIFIGGKTGEGKSTTVANIAFTTLKQINPQTGKTCKVLVITNEEKAEDVYNRVTSLSKGWAYTNHDKFSDEQRVTFSQNINVLASGGRLTVIADDHEGTQGMTTSIEGICNIFDNLIRDKIYYDVIIIDYYQNIKFSKLDPTMDEFKVQAKLAAVLDAYKNVYPAPIVLMGQVNPPEKDDKTPFQYRIKGRKIIMDVATCVIEMIADRENYRTTWIIHKSRFNESVGAGFHTGFSRGRYVPYDTEFKTEVNRMKEARMFNKAGVATPEDKAAGAKMKELTEKKEKMEK